MHSKMQEHFAHAAASHQMKYMIALSPSMNKTLQGFGFLKVSASTTSALRKVHFSVHHPVVPLDCFHILS